MRAPHTLFNTRSRRPAYTLVELLIVIAIIATLVGLLLAAVMAVRNVQYRTQVQYEITKMSESLGIAMSGYAGKPTVLPSRLLLYNDLSKYKSDTSPLSKRSADTLRKLFGRRLLEYGTTVNWNGSNPFDATASTTLEGQECLVFYLGGVPGTDGTSLGCFGFSTDPLNPMKAGGERYGPYYEFNSSRLQAGPSKVFYTYKDAYNRNVYAYFSTTTAPNNYSPYGATDCPSLNVSPYFVPGSNANGALPKFINPNSFQIISAGKDGVFGAGGDLWDPKIGSSDPATKDDLANFSKSALLAPQS